MYLLTRVSPKGLRSTTALYRPLQHRLPVSERPRLLQPIILFSDDRKSDAPQSSGGFFSQLKEQIQKGVEENKELNEAFAEIKKSVKGAEPNLEAATANLEDEAQNVNSRLF